jgi:hypothetical protein
MVTITDQPPTVLGEASKEQIDLTRDCIGVEKALV